MAPAKHCAEKPKPRAPAAAVTSCRWNMMVSPVLMAAVRQLETWRQAPEVEQQCSDCISNAHPSANFRKIEETGGSGGRDSHVADDRRREVRHDRAEYFGMSGWPPVTSTQRHIPSLIPTDCAGVPRRRLRGS